MKLGNRKNLITTADLSEDERKEMASKGGKASGEVRRQKKLMRETIIDLLKTPMRAGDLGEITDLAHIKGVNLTVQEAILVAQIKSALMGNVQSAQFIRDTAGQKPVDGLNITGSVERPLEGITTEDLMKIIDKVDDEDPDEADE